MSDHEGRGERHGLLYMAGAHKGRGRNALMIAECG